MESAPKVNVDEVMSRAAASAAIFSEYDQESTDSIVEAVAAAAFAKRVTLAKMAYEETALGVWQDKVIKNVIASLLVAEDMRGLKTVGIISEDKEQGLTEIAQPLGPIFGVIPVTNPTSTVMFKILIALKARNPIIISPHRRATQCCIETARICYEAALEAGAPDDCIQWVHHTTREDTHAFMAHKHTALILATGGMGLVMAAYSSGTPAIGVGAGNVPVYIDETADPEFAVEQILASKTFDNGTICASEQAVVVDKSLAPAVQDAFMKRGGYFLSPEEIKRLEPVAYDAERRNMSGDIVGQNARFIAEKAGIKVPPETRLLLAPLEGIGDAYPLSSEILAPILAYYEANGFKEAVNMCLDLNFHGGMGHTASIFSNNDEQIAEYAALMTAGRVVVNTPSSQGAVGGIMNRLHPSLTLGCGTSGNNITTDNVTARNLINIQRVAHRRDDLRLEHFDFRLFEDESLSMSDIETELDKNI